MKTSILSDSEIRKLLSGVDSNRDHAIIVLFLSTGLFLHELVALDVSDIHWSNKTLTINGKRQRTIPLNPEVFESLTRWHNHRMDTPEPALFVTEKGKPNRISERSVDHVIRSYGIDAKLDHPISAQVLRHTCVLRLLSKTDISDKDAVKLLGLDKETIDRYRDTLKETAPQKPTPDNPLDALDTRSHLAKVVTTMFPSIAPEDPSPSNPNPQSDTHLQPVSIGREKIVEKILKDLDDGRSILLTGPLGIGKSHVLNIIANGYSHSIVMTSPTPIKTLLLSIAEKVIPGECTNRTSAQDILSQIQSATILNPPILIIDNLHRLKAPDLDILCPLAEQFIILGATDDTPERLNSLWWKLTAIELNTLTYDQSLELIRSLTEGHSVEDRRMLETRITSIANGLPLAIVEMISQLSINRIVTPNQARQVYHSAGVRHRDWTWVLMIFWGVLVISRFVALGTHSFEGYILAGIGTSIFMVLKYFVKLKR